MKLRKVLIIIAAICVTGIGGLAIWIMHLDPKEITALAERKTAEATGRQLHIDGTISLKFSLIPTLAIDGVRFQNAAWGSQPDMLSVKHAEIQLALLPLFHRQIALRKVVLIEPQILLEANAKGDKNWVFDAGKKSQSTDRQLTIDIAALRIEQGSLVYKPGTPAQTQQVHIASLSLKTSGGSQATIDANATVDDVPIELAGVIPSPGQLATRSGAASKLDLKVTSAGTTLALSGQIPAAVPNASPLEGVNLRFTAQTNDPSAFAKQFKISLPHLPATQIEGQAGIAKSILKLDFQKFQIGHSVMHAQLRMPFDGERRSVSFNADSTLIDLREIFGPIAPAKTKKAAGSDGRLFSDDTLPVKNLSAFDMTGDLKVARLVLRDGHALQALNAKADLRRGTLRLDPISVNVDNKPLRATVLAEVSNDHALSMNVSLEGKGVALSALAALADVAAVPEGAPTDLSIHYSGRGTSIRQLAASANGDVRVVVGPGRWKGKAFDVGEDITEVFKAIMPTGTSTSDYTELQCAVIRFPLKQGVARIENGIGIETTKVKVLATGVVDLRNETINMGFHPKAGTGLGVGIGNLAQLVRVGGTLSNPEIKMDPVGAATTAAELGLAAYTGGASLLAQRLFSGKSIDNPCNTALGKSSSTQADTSSSKAAPSAKTDVEQISHDAANALRGLFGGKR
ncbi:MAG TPA: AsmA family protein [Rhodocyclaceae bacterium]|nr:AsmA family protein [Rhodocyclaceae bacterium]